MRGEGFVFLMILFCVNTLSVSGINTRTKEAQVMLSPQIHTFFKEDYAAENQNWDISSSQKGAVYIANSLGLLRYDGENWDLFETTNLLRSVYCSKDTIYVGGNGLVGYFLENDLDKGFQSISKITTDIWKIFRYKDRVVFQSFNRLFLYSQDGSVGIERIRQGNTTYAYSIDNEVFFQLSYGRLMALSTSGEERNILETDQINDLQVRYISRIDSSDYLLGTLNNGLFFLRDGQLIPVNNELNELLKRSQINKVISLDNGYYAFATMNGGVVIGNLKGQIKYILNTSNGLSNNRIHAVYKQKNNLLWIGTDRGISMIDLDSPLLYLQNYFYDMGSYYDVVDYNNQYYIATNQGLYRARRSNKQFFVYDISFVEGSDGQVWNIDVVDDLLWVGHNDGTFILRDQKLRKISDISGGYCFLKSRINENYMYQTSYYGVAVYSKTNNNWKYDYTISNIEGVTRDVIELKDGSLVVTGLENEAFQVWPDHTTKQAKTLNITKIAAFKSSVWVRAFEMDGMALLVASDTTLFYDGKEVFSPNEELNRVSYISEKVGENYFLRKENELQLYNTLHKQIVPLSVELKNIERELIYKYEHIGLFQINDFAFCLSNKLAFANLDNLINAKVRDGVPRITRVELSNDRNRETGVFNPHQKIPYYYNSIKLSFTAYNFTSNSSYEYYLDGYNQEWMSVGRNWVVFQNLPEGNYTFNVREKGSEHFASLAISINPPWYRSVYAYFGYVLLVLVLFYVGDQLYQFRARKQKLMQLHKERKRLNQQRNVRAKQLLNQEVKELQNEVSNKTDKLANLLIQNDKKKEVIEKINDGLKEIKDSHRFVNSRQLERLSKMIKSNFDEKKDWMVFEAAFSETHVNFFNKLRKTHPNLTDEDLRLCAYLKVNLSSKELAPIFKIGSRSVDLKKYRLKKKLNLSKDQDLKRYIMDFND